MFFVLSSPIIKTRNRQNSATLIYIFMLYINYVNDWTRRSRVQPLLRSATVEIDREIFSTVILSLPLIQERKLSVSGERMCTVVNSLED